MANWWTDPRNPPQPLQPYRLVASRSAALQPQYRVQCPYRWKLFHFTAAPSKDSSPSGMNRRRTMHSHLSCVGARNKFLQLCFLANREYGCDARSCMLSSWKKFRTCDSAFICIDTWDRCMIYRRGRNGSPVISRPDPPLMESLFLFFSPSFFLSFLLKNLV